MLKNGEGGFVADAETLDRIEGEGQVVARYLDDNPNGSMRDIAGITNERGNVVGLMPHPEHAVEDAHRRRHRRARLLHLAGRRDVRVGASPDAGRRNPVRLPGRQSAFPAGAAAIPHSGQTFF